MTERTNGDQIDTLLRAFAGQHNTLVVYRPFVEFMGTHVGALFLSQLIYWSDRTSNPDGWFHKSYAEWETEIGASRHRVSGAIKKCKKMGFLETKVQKVNGVPKMHFLFSFSDFRKSMCEFFTHPMCEKFTHPYNNVIHKPQHKPHNDFAGGAKSENGKKTNPTKKRKQTDRQRVLSELENYFHKISGIPLPLRKTTKQRREAAVRWWNPLLEFYQILSNKQTKYDKDHVRHTCDLIRVVVAHMRQENLTISDPASIRKNFISTYAEQKSSGSQWGEF